MQDKRPSVKEIENRLKEAKNFLSNHSGLFANPSKVVGELNALDIGDTNEVWRLIKDLLDEITSKDYRGTRPPQKSYEKAIDGAELFAFSWWSQKCDKHMYIKFVLKNERYYYVSLHESRSAEQKGEA